MPCYIALLLNNDPCLPAIGGNNGFLQDMIMRETHNFLSNVTYLKRAGFVEEKIWYAYRRNRKFSKRDE
jgi:hypothetical protein